MLLLVLLGATTLFDAFGTGVPVLADQQGPATLPEATESTAGGSSSSHENEDAGGGHHPEAPVLLAIMLILLLAKTSGDLFERLGMPAVLGELSVGVVIGNWMLLTGDASLEFFHAESPRTGEVSRTGETIDILARIGVVLLLFEIGLESRVREMLSVGASSMLVAILGVVAPILLGWGVGLWLIPDAGWQVHAFIGATLCATSVGITARVLKDLGRSQQKESQIILGAAVIDDVLGLVVLAVVSGVITATAEGEEFHVLSVFQIVGFSIGFLVTAMVLGAVQFPRMLFRWASYLRGHGLLVATALVICFGFAYAANLIGLAPIIGAFAAGLILDGAHYQEPGGKWEHHRLEDALAPLTAILVPIFFVGMGIQVDLDSFREPSVWNLAAMLTVAALIGKQVCAFGVREPGLNSTAVGLGMIPRGEVGLIFADQGRQLEANGVPVIARDTYSAVVVMVMITTMVTPPLLKWSLARGNRETDADSPPSDAPSGPTQAGSADGSTARTGDSGMAEPSGSG